MNIILAVTLKTVSILAWQYEFLQVLSIYHLNRFQFHNDRYYLSIKKNKFVCVYVDITKTRQIKLIINKYIYIYR